MARIALIASLVVLSLVTVAAADGAHSGRIVAIDAATRTLTLEELGPAPGEAPVAMTRAVEVSPDTRVELFIRAEGPGETDWPGGFAAKPLTTSELRPGDFATVTVVTDGARLRAQTVAVVRPGE